MAPVDPPLPAVFTRADTVQAGLTKAQVQRRLASGRWRRLRRGAFCLAAQWDAARPDERYRLTVLAAARVVEGPHAVSHVSAAALHGLPLPRGTTRAWLTTPPGSPARYLRDLVVQSATLPPADVRTLGGIHVTSRARTVADCLRHLDTVGAVAIADAALHAEPDLAPHLARVLDYCGSWPYAARAHARLPLVDGRRESPAESRSYVLMHQLGVPLPEPQVTVHDEHGAVVARVDALWDEWLVGEVDGLVKYGLGTGLTLEDGRRALVREKEREDALRDLGLEVVRWGTRDLAEPARWAARLRARLARPSGHPVTARFTYSPSDAAHPPSDRVPAPQRVTP